MILEGKLIVFKLGNNDVSSALDQYCFTLIRIDCYLSFLL